MTDQEARERATKLGLSAWVVEVVAAGRISETIPLKCVGFASADVPFAEAETWEEAFNAAIRIIFHA